MKREQFVKVLFIAVIMISFGGAINAFGQSNEQHLPCLKKVYLASDGQVELNCKPEESKYIAYNRFEWTVNEIKGKGRIGNEIKEGVTKKGGKYYLLPSEIYEVVGDKEVVVVYSQKSDNIETLILTYRIKVSGGQ